MQRAPLIIAGQVYLSPKLNEYLVVTSNVGGYISYSGFGFMGKMDDDDFIETFPPVNPADLSEKEIQELTERLAPGVTLTTGFYNENHKPTDKT